MNQSQLDFLQEAGINLVWHSPLREFPADVLAQLEALCPKLDDFQQLILWGNAGSRLWKRTSDIPHRIDRYSLDLVPVFVEAHLDGARFEILYPGRRAVPLLALGECAGWHHPSPFGTGVRDDVGPWFAYRAVFLSAAELEPLARYSGGHPCETCATTPCLPACPVGATSKTGMDWQKCVDFRLREGSTCANRCLARLACPVGATYRYEEDQLHYHYDTSLASIRRLLDRRQE